MKKFLSLLILVILLIIPNVKAEQLDSVSVDNVLQKEQIFYGNEIYFNASTNNLNKYQISEYLCNENECIDSTKDRYHDNLKAGKYTYGIIVTPIGDNNLSEKFSWNLNGSIEMPIGCGGRKENSNAIGCDFYEVEVKDWEQTIDEIVVENVKTDFKVGDTPTFTGISSGKYKDYYEIVEGWCDEPDGIFNENANCAFSNNPDGSLKKFEAKKYYYVISFFVKKESYALKTQNAIINGVKYSPTEDVSGMGDYSFGEWLFFTMTPSIDVKTDTETEDNKQVALEVSNIISKALDALEKNESFVGITNELTKKIKTALEAGQVIKTEVVSNNVPLDKMSETVKEKVEKAKESTYKILGYFDVNLEIKASNDTLGKVTKLDNYIKVTLDTKELVKSLPSVENGKIRVYKIVRIHDGETDVLDATLNEDNTLTFKTDRFSDYIVTYDDVENKNNTSNPQTLDNVFVYVIIAVVSIAGIAVSVLYSKKEKNC